MLLSVSAFAQTAKKAIPKSSSLARPKLIVGIVVDQMRYDYLYRYYDQYQEGGFKRMMNEGFNCQNNHYSYALTVTAAGHASAYTGSVPAINGIVGNEWFDPIAKQSIYCVEDSTVRTVGSNNPTVGKMSPKNLLTSTVSDQLRIATNFRNKTIAVAIKDRGSILPGGHTANGSYWFDSKTGNWVTSTYYMDDLPQWVKDYNAKKMPSAYLQKGWQLLLSADNYGQSSPDDVDWEGKLPGAKRPVFPYDLAGLAGDAFGVVTDTPWGNTITKEMAIEAIKGENLGKGKDTDFLAISFSSTDKIGHRVGPNSIEQQDDFLRLDREFAELFGFLDGWVGKGEYTVFLTADHGVVDVPGFAAAHKLPSGLVERKVVTATIDKALDDAFGKEKYILSRENNQLYFDHSLLLKKKLTVAMATEVIREALLKVPGVADVLNLTDMGKAPMNTYQLELYKNNVNAKRSGDVQILTEPGWFYGTSTGTSHGTGYNYDTQVPFVMFGWGINKGETLRRTSVSDIAPTISALLHILPASGNIGNPVEEAIKK
ncbi:alkaline phosphatase PafA [Dyadobacter fanqingshengii]|uniref:Alkaline phosphatase family protein n=1 Tax=Dyadobacter fanqingshengii TaxID=2906443 RepID=A0A9X1PGY2_9BACT|nr:alkaline phosphatase PafA [Dyadobacter fanqingshengii]MCF0043092.1 alkaline phosphatase family protein [Dyadobacter fanqingshengii]USJ35645.1 alkaline phosphatase family protein [Dyadobacter fanqingshengii]